MKRAAEILTPLYMAKYSKLYDIIERFVARNNLRIYGLLALSKKYDPTTLHSPHYAYSITCRNPLAYSNELTNELHKAGYNVVLKTLFLFYEYAIDFEHMAKCTIVTFTGTHYTDLTFMYWTLSDLTQTDAWDAVLEYERRAPKPSAKRLVAKLPEQFPLDMFKNYVVLGELAYYLKHKSILLPTSFSKPLFTALRSDNDDNAAERPMRFFKYSVIERPQYTIILYNLLKYVPVKVDETIDGIRVADPNIILYFLAVNNQTQYMSEFKAKKMDCADASLFVGAHLNLSSNKRAPPYSPRTHLLENKKYREIRDHRTHGGR